MVQQQLQQQQLEQLQQQVEQQQQQLIAAAEAAAGAVLPPSAPAAPTLAAPLNGNGSQVCVGGACAGMGMPRVHGGMTQGACRPRMHGGHDDMQLLSCTPPWSLTTPLPFSTSTSAHSQRLLASVASVLHALCVLLVQRARAAPYPMMTPPSYFLHRAGNQLLLTLLLTP